MNTVCGMANPAVSDILDAFENMAIDEAILMSAIQAILPPP